MSNIIKKLQNTIKDATGLRLYYMDEDTLDAVLDDAHFPCAVSALVDSGTISSENGRIHERLTFAVLFCRLGEFDMDGIQHEDIIGECKKDAFAWVTNLRTSDLFNIIGEPTTQRHYLRNDVMLDAFSVTITLEEVEGFGKCNV